MKGNTCSIYALAEGVTAPEASLDGRISAEYFSTLRIFASDIPPDSDVDRNLPIHAVQSFPCNAEESIFRTSEQWAQYPPKLGHKLVSLGLHAIVAAAVVLLGMWRVDPFPAHAKLRFTAIQLIEPTLKVSPSKNPPLIGTKSVNYGGGGGGVRSQLPVNRGRLPRPAPRQLILPDVNRNPMAQMLVAPTIVVGTDLRLKDSQFSFLGLPQSVPGPPSGGPGNGGGIGSGIGTGVGSGSGSGLGPGSGGGTGGSRFVSGSGIEAPKLLSRVEPEYTQAAYDAKLQGSVVLEISVDTAGRVQVNRVIRGLGMGLNEKAIEAVSQWRFKPAMRDGQPFALTAVFEVFFRL